MYVEAIVALRKSCRKCLGRSYYGKIDGYVMQRLFDIFLSMEIFRRNADFSSSLSV